MVDPKRKEIVKEALKESLYDGTLEIKLHMGQNNIPFIIIKIDGEEFY